MADNKLLSLNEIFNEKFFRIPDFQRGYSWGETQLEDYWEDIINLRNGRFHYTGMLTVEPVSKEEISNIENWQDDLWLFEKGYKSYYLIDGQQRLTTAIILINEILSSLDDDEDILFESKLFWIKKFLFQAYKGDYKSYIFGYERDNPSDEFFKTKILNQQSSTSDKVPENTLYTTNLQAAKTFFQKKLANTTPEQNEKVFKKLVSALKFNFYEIDDELDVFVTFETMNNRGKPLSNLELLKNRLIYLSTLLDIDKKQCDRLRKEINESWKTIYEFLGKNKDKRLDDDAFLRDHWIMYFTYDRSVGEAYAKFLLNEYFTVKNLVTGKIDFEKIKNYTNSLQETVKYWFYLHTPSFSPYSDETKEWLQKINRLRMGAFAPLLMAVISKDNEKDFLPLLKTVERFIFLLFNVTQRRSNTANSTIYGYANKYYWKKEKISLEQIIEEIDYLIDGGYENDAGEYVYDGWTDLQKFSSYIDELMNKNNGFYDWSGLRYFLYEYELYLQQQAKGDQKVTWQEFSKRKKEETIEHIYPQTPTDPYWKERFKGFKNREKNYLLHSLGNLLLLSRSKNSELQNFDFPYKKKHKKDDGSQSGFFNGSYSEIEVANEDDWNPNVILEHGMKMLHFMEERWNVNFEDWELNKQDVLGLSFMDIK